MNKNVKCFRDLSVFQKAYDLSLEIHKISKSLPKEEQYGLADQMRRGSKSICANIAEGFAKQRMSSAEFRRFLSIALGSSEEMRVWLQYCHDLEYINKKRFSDIEQRYIEISKMLFGLHNNWK